MSVVGIDLGNENSVVAVARQRGIDVVLNQESKRESPSVVTFGDKQRLIGSAASSSALMNPTNTISQIKRLLARSFADLRPDLPSLPFKVSPAPDGSPLLHVRHLGVDRAFTPTQVLAMLLSDLKSLAEIHLRSAVVDCCIGIPSHFTDPQRRAVLDAAKIAGLNPLRLIHETTAVALEYGIYKSDLSETETRNVVFVDVGHASMQVCVAGYRKGELKVLSHAFDRSLGGRDFDEALFRHFAAKFCQETGIDVSSNPRACVRLRAACEKLKKTLSANPEAPLNVECLVNDMDFRGFIKREEFERISEPVLQRVKAPLEKALADAGISVNDVHVIEVVGSGSRVPAITKILTSFFGKEPRHTMNASECVARGCALQCAMLSPTFKVKEFKVVENFPFNVDLVCGMPSSEHAKPAAEATTLIRAFSKGELLPTTKTLHLSNESLLSVDLVYADASELGVPEIISQYKISPSQLPKGERASLEIGVSLNHHGILFLDSATVVEEIEDPKSTTAPATELLKTGADNESDLFASKESLDMKVEVSSPNPIDSEVEPVKVETNDARVQPEETADTSNAEVKNDAQNDEHHSENKPIRLETNKKVGDAKEKRTCVSISECNHGVISPTNLQKLIEEERQMALQDKIMEETKDKKNAVETYIYDMRNKIYDKYKDFVSDQERETFSKKLQETEDWLYEEGDDATKDVYISKLGEIKKFGDPIETRFKEDSERGRTANELYHCICSFRNAVQSNDPRLDHIDIAEKQKVLEACNRANNWFNEKWQQQSALPKHANPVVSSSEITRWAKELDSYCKKILFKPKPEPPKTQKVPKDAPKPEAAAGQNHPNANGNAPKEPSAKENTETPGEPATPGSSEGAPEPSAA